MQRINTMHTDSSDKENPTVYPKPVSGRNVAALLNPRPVVVIGACHDDMLDFATVAWISPVSHTPPLLVFALRESSFTFQLLSKSGWCSINIPSAKHKETVVYCGNISGASTDKINRIPYKQLKDVPALQKFPENGEVIPRELPLLPDALSLLMAKTLTISKTGDHMLVTAEIKQAFSRCAFDDAGRTISTDTLLCVQHDLFATSNTLFTTH